MVHEIVKYQERIGCTIDALAEEMQHIAETVAQNPLITFRVKDPETLLKKMRLKNVQSIFSIDDIYAICIIVESIEGAYRVLDGVSQTFPGYLDHDYIREPKTNSEGKMLRLLQFIAYKNGVPFEIQITTAAFQEANEGQHKRYHERKYGESGL